MVSEFIIAEGNMCTVALFWGMVLALEYDCIRVFRRVFRHRKVWTTSIEDIIYWIAAGIQVFSLIYETGDGVVRGFLVVAMVLGATLYRYAIGKYFVKYISKFLIFALKPLKKLLGSIRIVLKRRISVVKASFNKKKLNRKLRREAKRSQSDETGVKKRKRKAA